MKCIVFGASGMVGSGVLRECLNASDVDAVLTVGRAPLGITHPRLTDLVLADLFQYDDHDASLTGYQACFFCLGISSAGLSEDRYRHVTHDLTVAAAQALIRLNPDMVFVFVSGAGTDSSEQGASMWARIKGKTENALLGMPFKSVALFRPGLIRPMDGAVSKTLGYRVFYALFAPIIPLVHRVFPRHVVSTRDIGQAMLAVARAPAHRAVYEVGDIRRAAEQGRQ